MTQRALHLGVDIGGTNIKLGLIDADGRILHQTKTPTAPERGSDAIVASIASSLQTLLREASVPYDNLNSIGIGVPGTADANTGMVVYAPNIFWRDVPIVARMRARFPLPIYIAQDTRAAAWAEFLVGTARGLRGIAAVTLGTGIGCGMVLDGRIFHGALNTAGEFGHQIVVVDGEACNCGRRGCLEAHAGGLAIVREAKKRIPNLQDLVGKNDIGVEDVYRLTQQGNLQARQIADEVVRHVGVGLVNLINLNSLEMICLSGGISNAPAELLLDPLVAFVRSHAYQAISERVQIRRSALGEDAPLIGASLLHRAFAPERN